MGEISGIINATVAPLVQQWDTMCIVAVSNRIDVAVIRININLADCLSTKSNSRRQLKWTEDCRCAHSVAINNAKLS